MFKKSSSSQYSTVHFFSAASALDMRLASVKKFPNYVVMSIPGLVSVKANNTEEWKFSVTKCFVE